MTESNIFIAVHAGAGYHSPNKETEYRDVCKTACLQAVELLKSGGSIIHAVTAATVSLENAGCTNAGVGSSLTIDGTVECDASIIDGQTSHYGSVGCLQGVKNPIKAAMKLVEIQKHGNLSLGRIPPSVLVGHGARKWCEQNGVDTCDPSLLVTDSSKRMHLKYRRKMDACSNKHEPLLDSMKKKKKEESTSIQDTVGAVCMDSSGNVAATSSSGGIWLKHSGRIGPAATYGAGCWARSNHRNRKPAVAVSTSGSGEDIIKCLLAKTCGDAVQRADDINIAISEVFKEEFMYEVDGENMTKNGGVLVLKSENIDSVELVWAHTTDSMCIGFMSSINKTPKTFISRLPNGSQSGISLKIEGKYFDFTNKK